MTVGSPTIEGLDQRVKGLEADFQEIKSDVKGIRTEISGALSSIKDDLSNRNRTQWPVLLSGLIFMMAVLGFVGTSWKTPIETTAARQETDIRMIQQTLSNQMVPRSEHMEKWRQFDAAIEANRDRVTREVALLSARLERMENKLFFNADIDEKKRR